MSGTKVGEVALELDSAALLPAGLPVSVHAYAKAPVPPDVEALTVMVWPVSAGSGVDVMGPALGAGFTARVIDATLAGTPLWSVTAR